MSTGWVLLAFVGPPVAASLGFLLRGVLPETFGVALNALVPGAGLAQLDRPVIEVAVGTIVSVVALLTIGEPSQLGMYVPVMVIGGVWASLYTSISPVKLVAKSTSVGLPQEVSQGRPAAGPVGSGASRPTPKTEDGDSHDAGFAVQITCPECGAAVAVPVLHRMARCSYCGSRHLVYGHEEILQVALPEKTTTLATLLSAVLEHYRYQYYLRLYSRQVAPLDRQTTATTADGQMYNRPEIQAAAAAAEKMVAQKADAYRDRLRREITVRERRHFWSPYWHGMGTLYEATFGRDRRSMDKKMGFAISTIEASTPASGRMELPAMGHLSYLRALVPAAELGRDNLVLPRERDAAALEAAYGNLNRKQIDKSLQLIKLGTAFVSEVRAVVWRPWRIVEVNGPRLAEALLVDSAAGSVVGPAPELSPDDLGPPPEETLDSGIGLKFTPMECPTCGYEFPFDVSAVVHFCTNCHRAVALSSGNKVEVPYDSAMLRPESEYDLVPFWRFRLRLVTPDGRVTTDIAHLTDGIDGTLDQIGEDAPVGRDEVLVPAFRLINSRLMTTAFTRFAGFSTPFTGAIASGRFPLDDKPQPWPVSLSEAEARRFVPLYLANVFGLRDLARANIHEVSAGLFEARQESPGRLTYVGLPKSLTEPFRAYVGRFQATAVARVEGIQNRS